MSASTPNSPGRIPSERLGVDNAEIAGALDARRSLGIEAESDIIDSFMERASAAIDARVDQRIAEYSPASNEGSTDSGGFWLAAVSIGMGIPITGVATSFSDSGSTLVAAIAWAGIAVVNAAYNFRRNR
ncbi:hypothetical protein [Streptomyces sp. DH8]|uniref:hypothetical protein n=1 Tax=Streptomyces sp. DH8 TaxID=2857008 RepID=UPI001E31DE05|nr:hypothetical protein [Streptomyces sp. DH8]